jgi:hypothetical protein
MKEDVGGVPVPKRVSSSIIFLDSGFRIHRPQLSLINFTLSTTTKTKQTDVKYAYGPPPAVQYSRPVQVSRLPLGMMSTVSPPPSTSQRSYIQWIEVGSADLIVGLESKDGMGKLWGMRPGDEDEIPG